MPEISWEKVKEQKVTISIATLVVILGFAWKVLGWSEDWHLANFVSKAEAAEHQRQVEDRVAQLSKQVQGNSNTLDSHVHEFRLYAAVTRVSALEDRLDRVQRQEFEHGTTPQLEAERRKLEKQLANAEQYQTCVLNQGHNCQILLEQQ